MKLSHFRTAAAIAEHGSLRAAARNLGVAQPSLTRGLSELEREIGAPLFERRSKGMIATPIGEAFVRRRVRSRRMRWKAMPITAKPTAIQKNGSGACS